MRRIVPIAALVCITVWTLGAGAEEPTARVAGRGVFPEPHVSGAAVLGDRLYLTASGGAFRLVSLPLAGELPAPGAVPVAVQLPAGEIDDVREVAADPHGRLLLIASHSRTRFGDTPEPRYRLARLSPAPAPAMRTSSSLLEAIRDHLPFLADSIRRTPARTGLNIEGAAWVPPGHLLLGLRSPTVTESTPRPHGGQEDAVVLRIRNPLSLFADPPSPADMADPIKLDLHGQGIRAMAWDPVRKCVWIVSGLSPEPGHPVRTPWSLWQWDQEAPPRAVDVPDSGLEEVQAACVLPGQPTRLLLVEGAARESRWIVVEPR